MGTISLTSVLTFGNLILASANVIIGFSLVVYVATHNLRSSVARAFCALMAFVTVVYLVDVGIGEATSQQAAHMWLRAQWLGIAFVPAAYFSFSDALLRTTGSISRWRSLGVGVSYLLGLLALAGVVSSDLVVDGLQVKQQIYHLRAGPLFWAFAVYYLLTTVAGWVNIRRARARCLTSASRRRMSYLMLAIIAPGLGAFPYLLVPTTAQYLTVNMVLAAAFIRDAGIALMTLVIGYSVAYQGVLLPDRVIKHSLIHYLLRGPLVAILVIVIMLTIPRVEPILGLPRDTVLIVTVAGSVVVLQLLVNVAKPAIDRLIYRRDRKEIAWIQALDQHLLTTTDLEQLLENTLITLVDLLRVPSGFIITIHGSSLAVSVFCGPREMADGFLSRVTSAELDQLSKSRLDESVSNEDWVPADGHWLLPLRSRTEHATLGLLGIRAAGAIPIFGEQDLDAVYALVRRAEMAMEDVALQRRVFAILQGMGSELDQIQQWRSIPRFVRNGSLGQGLDPVDSPGFAQIVKDALTHLWGGPKLSQSPLVSLHVVRERMGQNDNVPTKALRSVLQEAIERLKPDGARSMTASEWIVYNILDLKFVQGQRIRDIAMRLAMSESDFYRKQRIAVEQVAETLAQMERDRKKD
jgi:hypothetical protein